MRQRRPRSLPIRPGRNLARNGWSYLQTSGSVPAPDGPYHDDDDRNDRFRAAAELFRAMGEAPFHDYLLANYQSFAAAFSASENAHGATLMDLSAFLTCLRSDNRDAAAVSWITALQGMEGISAGESAGHLAEHQRRCHRLLLGPATRPCSTPAWIS